MNKNTYITCLASNGIASTGSSGSILGLYDFVTGFDSKIVFNQTLTDVVSGHYFSGLISTANYPLVALNSAPANTFNLNDCFSFGKQFTGNFSLIIDFDYNACQRNTTGKDYILLSNIPNESGINTGFYIGINEANRLFIQTSGIARTLNPELKTKNLLYLSFSDQKYLNFGIFELTNNSLISNSITLDNPLSPTMPFYLGGFLNSVSSAFTGFSGNINNLILFNNPVDFPQVSGCIDCLFVTGFSSSTNSVSVQLPIITGYVTGTQNTTGVVFTPVSGNLVKSNGTTIPIYFLSGSSGIITGNTATNILTGSSTINLPNIIVSGYLYNQNLINQYASYNTELRLGVTSGDYVEIYTYNRYNPKVNKTVNGFNWPDEIDNIQLIGNGLIETTGVDYSVINSSISGYDITDNLKYDLYSGKKFVTTYSGVWSRDRITLSGGVFYPVSSQYIESGSGVIVTGVSGNLIPANYDVYMNGQKLISGVHYSRIQSGSFLLVALSGNNLPDFTADGLYSITGGLPTGITNIHDSELVFYPLENSPNSYVSYITGSGIQYILTGITGFNEQVWINGVRQSFNIGYIRDYPCALSSGLFTFTDYGFNFYNNDTRFFNIV